VINFELPNVSEDYVHRIGRTGRAGRSGEAVSLVSPDEDKLLRAIERMTKQRIDEGTLAGFEPPAQAELNSDRPERARGGAGGGGGGRNQQRSNSGGGGSNGRGQGAGQSAGPGRGQGRNDKPQTDRPRGPRRPVHVIKEPEDAVTLERRRQANGNRADPVTSDKPARKPNSRRPNNRGPQREKPALLGPR